MFAQRKIGSHRSLPMKRVARARNPSRPTTFLHFSGQRIGLSSYGVGIGAETFECIPLASGDPDSVATLGSPASGRSGFRLAGSLLVPALGIQLCVIRVGHTRGTA